MERANSRLRVVVPITALIIFALLYFNFRNIVQPILVMGAIPFGLIGGVWIIYYAGYNISVAVMIGFIALAGISTEISVLVLNFINIALKKRREESGKRLSADDIKEVTRLATSTRVRAVTMSAMTTMLGLIPIMLSTGTGSDVTQRIASPMLGGMVTVMLFNLLALPAIYSLVLQFQEKRRKIEE
jgi:Cu(I)/Ag(I) efflux system membrane protein CusA/SilA